MLSENQIEQLQLLTDHPKYGLLLKNAMVTWLTIANPIKRNYGIFRDEKEQFCFADNDNKQCCLIGASIWNFNPIDIENLKFQDATAMKNYNISIEECKALIAGFDRSSFFVDTSEAYRFGKKVSEIIFGEMNK